MGRAKSGVVSVYDLPLLHDASLLQVEVPGGVAAEVTEVAALLRPREGQRLRVLRGVRFDLLVTAPAADFRIRYFVESARWAPTYALTMGSQARLRVEALVAQASGEDWDDARVKVCTTAGRGMPERVGLREASLVGSPEARLTAHLWKLMATSGGAAPEWLYQVVAAEVIRADALRAARLPDDGRPLRSGAAPLVLGGGRFDVAADGMWRALPVDERRVRRQSAGDVGAQRVFEAPAVPYPTGPLRIYEDGRLVARTLLRTRRSLTVPNTSAATHCDDAPTLLGGPLVGVDGAHSGALPTLVEVSHPASMLAEALGPAVEDLAPTAPPAPAPSRPVSVELPVSGRGGPTLEVIAGEETRPPEPASPPRQTGPMTLLAIDDLAVDEDPQEHALYEFLFGTLPPPEPLGHRPLTHAKVAMGGRKAGDLAQESAEHEGRLAVSSRHTQIIDATG